MVQRRHRGGAGLDGLNDLPVKTVNGATIYLRDVAHVRDGSAPQQNVVHVDGTRSVLVTILKNGATSTLSIVQGIKDKLPGITETLPASLRVTPIGDQSVFVRAAIQGVVKEGAIAAALTSLMILLFLGSWRSTVIIAISIPLAILFAIIFMWTPPHFWALSLNHADDYARAGVPMLPVVAGRTATMENRLTIWMCSLAAARPRRRACMTCQTSRTMMPTNSRMVAALTRMKE